MMFLNGKIKKIRDSFLEMMGMYDGRLAFKGPRCVQIDVTNQCNNDCIGCWCNSPLLEEKRLPASITDETLPHDLVLKLLDELKGLGTEEIYFAGGGEPFMHPHAMEIFAYAKKKGFIVSINTNFTLVTEKIAKQIVDCKIDHLIVSVWAGSADIYAVTHPNQSEKTFSNLRKTLRFLNQYKPGKSPFIKVYNVIFNLNYDNFDNMLDFVRDTHSESVEFTVIDTIPGKTDKLLMNKQQTAQLYERARVAQTAAERQELSFILENYHTFLRRVASDSHEESNYDKEVIHEIPCYTGWMFARIIANGDVNSCLKSHRIPIGNLYQNSFKQIWNNERQIEFRQKTRTIDANDPYFRFIGNDPYAKMGCYRSCDNIGHSLLMHNNVQRLQSWQKNIIKRCAQIIGGMAKIIYRGSL